MMVQDLLGPVTAPLHVPMSSNPPCAAAGGTPLPRGMAALGGTGNTFWCPVQQGQVPPLWPASPSTPGTLAATQACPPRARNTTPLPKATICSATWLGLWGKKRQPGTCHPSYIFHGHQEQRWPGVTWRCLQIPTWSVGADGTRCPSPSYLSLPKGLCHAALPTGQCPCPSGTLLK